MADMDLSILAGKFKQLRKMRDRLKSKETKSEYERESKSESEEDGD